MSYIALHICIFLRTISSMITGYKKLLLADWRTGDYSVADLAEKYEVTIFKVNLIIEKEKIRRAKSLSLI